MAEPLTCQELVELITEYLEDALPSERRLAFEQHIAVCPPCRGYLVELQRTSGALGKLTEEAIPVEAREAMLEVFRGWRTESG